MFIKIYFTRTMAFKMSREVLKDLQLTDVVNLDREIGRGAYGIVKEVLVHGTLCAAKQVLTALYIIVPGMIHYQLL